MVTTEPELHQAVAPLAFLLGTWTGTGRGHYPTIDDFEYEEEVRFWHVGRPYLAYAQRTWAPETGAPMHMETGYWRPQRDGRIEVVLAHPFGIAEILEGRLDGTIIDLESTSLAATATAKSVTGTRRKFEVVHDVLAYLVEMAAVEQPLQGHLTASLRRV